MNLEAELRRTAPDYVVFNPGTFDPSTAQCHNEHFLVETLPNGKLIAVWTQSSFENNPDQHIAFAKSEDGGVTWTQPVSIAPTASQRYEGIASWGFPVVSKSGKIYVLFFHNTTEDLWVSGWLCAMCSEDEGASWSDPVRVNIPRSVYDDPDESVPHHILVWQKPLRLAGGKPFVGLTRHSKRFFALPSVTEFMRFENVDDDPAPQELQITMLAQNENALQYGGNGRSRLEEPAIVALPDGRFFCTMRSSSGSPCWSVSDDAGETWSQAQVMRQKDNGLVLEHPISPCPIYQLADGQYTFFYHNHGGNFAGHKGLYNMALRRPICIARGELRPDAKQPLWFSEPYYLMDNGGVKLVRTGFSLYSSTTPIENGYILWYPDRKFFLLGRKITLDMVENLEVPEQASPENEDWREKDAAVV